MDKRKHRSKDVESAAFKKLVDRFHLWGFRMGMVVFADLPFPERFANSVVLTSDERRPPKERLLAWDRMDKKRKAMLRTNDGLPLKERKTRREMCAAILAMYRKEAWFAMPERAWEADWLLETEE